MALDAIRKFFGITRKPPAGATAPKAAVATGAAPKLEGDTSSLSAAYRTVYAAAATTVERAENAMGYGEPTWGSNFVRNHKITDPAVANATIAVIDRLHDGNEPASDLARLIAKDPAAFNQTVLKLSGYLDKPLSPEAKAKGIDAQQALRDLIADVARPKRISQGAGTATCAATVAEELLAGFKPSQFLDVSTQLLYGGKLTSIGGKDLKAPIQARFDELDHDHASGNGRNATDAVLQGSFMAYARSQYPDDSSDHVGGSTTSASGTTNGGKTTTKTGSGRGKAGTLGGDGDGLTPRQVQGLMSDVLGSAVGHQNILVSDGNRDAAFERLQQGVQTTAATGIPVGIHKDDYLHEVIVTGISNGHVHYIDPMSDKGDGRSHSTHDITIENFKKEMVLVTLGNQTDDLKPALFGK